MNFRDKLYCDQLDLSMPMNCVQIFKHNYYFLQSLKLYRNKTGINNDPLYSPAIRYFVAFVKGWRCKRKQVCKQHRHNKAIIDACTEQNDATLLTFISLFVYNYYLFSQHRSSSSYRTNERYKRRFQFLF